ncbi:Putative SANT/Myb domain, Homeobox-like domain superfamily protein [Septoria linicola]|uniref:SANT/Myb domain, Homeobox-like domain superfamily protein n=1 Tax=Septoria linicola TaxID=215465 RepID=A0A9Q9EPA8_9PEZI|nr:Putative SANT/Myb domain, Homeobox-like domain superfamily protein [Septoria linicola]
MSYEVNRWSGDEVTLLRDLRGIYAKLRKLKEREDTRNQDSPATEKEGLEVVDRRDRLGESFRQIAKHFGWTTGKVDDVYHSHKAWSPASPIGSRSWTDTEVEELMRLKDAGMKSNEIAGKLQRPVSGVSKKLSSLYDQGKYARRNLYWATSDLEKLRGLREEGRSYTEIARLMPGKTADTVASAWHRRIGNRQAATEGAASASNVGFLDPSTAFFRPWTQEELQTLAGSRRNGLSWSQIASKLPGRSANAIYLTVRRQNRKIEGLDPEHAVDEAKSISSKDSSIDTAHD